MPVRPPASVPKDHGLLLCLVASLACATAARAAEADLARLKAGTATPPAPGETRPAGEKIYLSQPGPDREAYFGCIGPTGVMARVYPGMKVTVEKTMPGSPAEGKFAPGDIITGINGTPLAGLNPFVALGDALTAAEAADGRMVFDVTSADGKRVRQETVTIPALGGYGASWPLDCAKSRRIVEQAAEFYADPARFRQGGIPGGLACLFLLSTGDDRYLPAVKAYFAGFPRDVRGIGMHTWNNGYNGIACGEYYLRTGDAAVLPILQYYCDDARDRQKFGCGWGHWDQDINPGYVAGGLVNAAGAQLLTTLLLGKECGVEVDDETVLGALRLFYRFAGRGTVPYGDHRGEGGLGSNGKDGMIAAAMQIAAGAGGDVTIYEEARRALALSMIDSYPVLVMGHGDEGRGDGIWRSITTASLAEERPALYREAMDRLTWWHDLSREPGGSIGIATLSWGNGEVGSSGPGMGFSYTAPLRTLRITGGPPTRHSKPFTLPARLWGTEADRAFLSLDHNPKYFESGPEEPAHIPFYALGGAYHQPERPLESLPRETLLKNVYHRNFMIRTQAGKALRTVGGFDDLERLLRDADPRVRRAALDGLTDYNYWFGIGRNPIPTEQFTPGMLESITGMLSDPAEAWWVVDAALKALKFAPPAAIQARVPLILPWTTHSDWWLRESAFDALSGLERDEALYLEILPTLLEMANDEYHTMPRARMLNHLQGVLSRKTPASAEGRLVVAGLERAIETSEIKGGSRSSEGGYNVLQACKVCVQADPGNAVAVARLAAERIREFGTNGLIDLVATPNARPDRTMSGLFTALATLAPDRRAELTDVLFTVYRPELIRRMHARQGADQPLLNTIIDLTRLENPAAGWKPLGTTPPAERIWRFRSFDPLTEKDRLHPREGKRFRDIELPEDLRGWQEPGYDDSGWQQGRAPVGVGLWKRDGISFANQSDWGKGEFIVMRTTFEVESLDFDAYRLCILARQGFRVFLNGHEISSYVWWVDIPHYSPRELGAAAVRHLKTGTNVLAAYGNVELDRQTHEPRGQMDLWIEGLRMADLK